MKKLIVVTVTLVGVMGSAQRQQPFQSTSLGMNAPKVCHSEGGLPDRTCTPGAVRTTDVQSICHGGPTKQYRPSSSYIRRLKVQQISEYGYADSNPSDYEEDHLIAIEIGGDGKDPKNLWPERHIGPNNSYDKDRVEGWLHREICEGAMTPEQAQHGVATDWRQYIRFVRGETASRKHVD